MHEPSSEPLGPLLPQDREEILVDLEDLEVFQTLLEPRGVRGLIAECGECDETHYFGWELLRQNLRQLLDTGHVRAHEPAFDPDPADYVAWEYAKGFVDGVLSASEEDAESEEDAASEEDPTSEQESPTVDLS